MAKISVIIPCYKVEQLWIERIFRTLQLQTIGFENLEIILVVDASPDDTFERLLAFEQLFPENVLLVNSTEKLGPGGARNVGMSYASADYIAFLDSDDWVEPHFYQHLYDKMIEYNCDMVKSYACHNSKDNSLEMDPGLPPTRNGNHEDKLWVLPAAPDPRRKEYLNRASNGIIGIWSILYNKAFLESNDICFPAIYKYEDNYFHYLADYCARRIYFLEEKSYHWMVSSNSITTTDLNITAWQDRMTIELLKLDTYKERGLFEPYHDEIERDFILLYYANTIHIITNSSVRVQKALIDHMLATTRAHFPNYKSNPVILANQYLCSPFVDFIIEKVKQLNPSSSLPSPEIMERIQYLSFLDVLDANLSQEELDWWTSAYKILSNNC